MQRQLFFCLLLAAALGSGCNAGTKNLPSACELLSIEAIKNIVQEPVHEANLVAAGLGELSACAYFMPGSMHEEMLNIFLMPPAYRQNEAQLHKTAAQWQQYNTGAEYELLTQQGYLMAWFPGEQGRYSPTLVVLFKQATLVLAGRNLEQAKSLAFTIMLEQAWDNKSKM